MLITQGEVESFDPHSGEFLQSTRIPAGFKWRNDRLFTSNSTLHALSHTGLSPHFEQVFPDDYRVSCTGRFYSHVHGGAVGVTLGGAFVTWDRKTILTSCHLSVPPPLRVADVSFNERSLSLSPLERPEREPFRFLAAVLSSIRHPSRRARRIRGSVNDRCGRDSSNSPLSPVLDSVFGTRWGLSGKSLITRHLA